MVGPPTALNRGKFFKTMAYHVGGHDFTLDDIEHGILRCKWAILAGT